MIWLVKRYPAESMIAAGAGLLVSAFCWAALIEHRMWDWPMFRGSQWFRQNWPVMIVAEALCTIGGVLLLVYGIMWATVLRNRRFPRG